MSIIVNTNGQAYIDQSGNVLEGIKPDIDIVQLNVNENGTYTASIDEAYSPVVVNVPETDVTQLNVTQNGTYTASSGEAYSPVVVNVPNPSTGNINITNMNQVDVSNYATAQVVDSDIVAGNIKKDVNILGVIGTYEGGGGSLDVQVCVGSESVASSSYVATNIGLTVAKTGTYKVSWTGARNTSSGTSGSQLYIDGTAYDTAQITFTNTYFQHVSLSGVELSAGEEIAVWARSRSTSYKMAVSNLIIELEE